MTRQAELVIVGDDNRCTTSGVAWYRFDWAGRAEEIDQVRALLATATLPVEGLVDDGGAIYVALEEGRFLGAIGLERYGEFGLLRLAVVALESRGKGIALI